MARKVVWTEPAADDLLETVEYIARDSPSYAAALAQKVCDAGDSLAELSERGRAYPDPAYSGFRELNGVFHGSRDVPDCSVAGAAATQEHAPNDADNAAHSEGRSRAPAAILLAAALGAELVSLPASLLAGMVPLGARRKATH